jgi:hypothetical protein
MRNNVQISLVETIKLLLREKYESRKPSHKQFGAKTAKCQGLPRRKREAIPVVDDAIDSNLGRDERLSRV